VFFEVMLLGVGDVGEREGVVAESRRITNISDLSLPAKALTQTTCIFCGKYS
jgi:hypothetical protein